MVGFGQRSNIRASYANVYAYSSPDAHAHAYPHCDATPCYSYAYPTARGPCLKRLLVDRSVGRLRMGSGHRRG